MSNKKELTALLHFTEGNRPAEYGDYIVVQPYTFSPLNCLEYTERGWNRGVGDNWDNVILAYSPIKDLPEELKAFIDVDDVEEASDE